MEPAPADAPAVEVPPAPSSAPVRPWRRWTLAGAFFLGIFLYPFRFQIERDFWERLMDAAHVPAFLVGAWFLFCQWPTAWSRSSRHWTTFLIGTGTAGVIEIVQHWTGRVASWGDFLNSTAGCFLFFVLELVRWRGAWMKALAVIYAGFIAAAALLPAWRHFGGIAWRLNHFPIIADFEEQTEFRLWWAVLMQDMTFGSTIVPSSKYATHGRQSAQVSFRAMPDYFPSIRIYLSDQDWRGYSTLAFDLFNPGQRFDLTLRIDDNLPVRSFTDRYYGLFPVETGWNHVRIPLSTIQQSAQQRPLNLAAIRRVIFFLDRPTLSHLIYLDWIRLE